MTARGSFPSLSPVGERRQARLVDTRLQAVVDTTPGDLHALVTRLCGASVDLIELRDDHATEDALRAAADAVRRACEDGGALFVLHGLPGLACQVAADGVHLGQHDVDPDHARTVCGPDLLLLRSVHTPRQIDASAEEDVDALVVSAREDVGIDALVTHAARHASHPWAVAGEDDPDRLEALLAQGTGRVVLGTAVTTGPDPVAAAWAARRALGRHHA